MCDRACNDEAICPCLAEPKIGLAYALIVANTNGNSVLEQTEIENTMEAIGWLMVGYSAIEHIPAPSPLDTLFVEGIDAGIRPYRIIPGNPFDDLGRTVGGEIFDLNLCGGSCSGLAPNLT